MGPHIKHSQLYPNQPGLVSRSSSKSLILRSLSGFTGFPSKYLSRSRRTGKALESNLSSSVASLEKRWCFTTSQVLWMKKLSLCFQMKERQIFVAVRPDGVGGVVLHPVQHLPGLHQLDQRAERRQVDQGLPLGRDHPRMSPTVLHQKLDTVLAELESSALRKSNSRYI